MDMLKQTRTSLWAIGRETTTEGETVEKRTNV
jgi:hypothetical protein